MSAPTRSRVCDFIASRLHSLGVKRVYGITGGGASGQQDVDLLAAQEIGSVLATLEAVDAALEHAGLV